MPDKLTEHVRQVAAEVNGAQTNNKPSGEKWKSQDAGERLDVPAYLSKYGIAVTGEKTHNGNALYCLKECVFDPGHEPNEAAIGQMPDGKLFYQCFHDSCQDKKWVDARHKISGDDKIMPGKSRYTAKIKQIPTGAVQVSSEEKDKSHSQIAEEYITKCLPSKEEVVGCEGALWSYDKETGLFKSLSIDKIAADIGKKYNLKFCRRLSDYKSIAQLVYTNILDENFFEDSQIGTPCKSFFVSVKNGEVIEQNYSPLLRQRFKLGFDPARGDCPMFSKYLNDSFAGDDVLEQIALVQQIMGGIVTCSFSRIQRAVLLIGAGSNGKSVLLELIDSFFPREMKAAVEPYDFGREYHCAHLAGKAVNLVGEIEKTKLLPAKFKDIVGCDTPVTARLPYRPVFEFKPRAAHMFACNDFPATADHSWGFYRRWVILEFPNTVDENDKIHQLGSIMVEKEGPQILAWVIAGARALAENRFKLALSAAHDRLLEEWKLSRDSVHAFLNDDEYVERGGEDGMRSRFFQAYKIYCKESNLQALGKKNFLARCRTQLGETIKEGDRYFVGARVRGEIC